MSKTAILKNIMKNKPAPSDLPVMPQVSGKSRGGYIQAFTEKAVAAGSKVENYTSVEKVNEWISRKKEGKTLIDLFHNPDEKETGEADMIVIKGQLGVAENGAVWIDEADMQVRKWPFVTRHLVLVLEKAKILTDMHAAYRQVDLNRTGFGVFVAGPSKTADIEQSLVIGAHGPIEHTILLY
jgi:L-lactate dehydrogenase complex protein LldG